MKQPVYHNQLQLYNYNTYNNNPYCYDTYYNQSKLLNNKTLYKNYDPNLFKVVCPEGSLCKNKMCHSKKCHLKSKSKCPYGTNCTWTENYIHCQKYNHILEISK